MSTILDHGYYPFTFKKRRKPCYLSQTAGLHRFLILFKDYNTAAFFTGSGFRVQRYEEKTRYVEKFREKRRIICKFLCIFVRIICKSLLISVRIVSFFSARNQPRKALLHCYLFTFKCPCRKNRNYYLCTMRLPESER